MYICKLKLHVINRPNNKSNRKNKIKKKTTKQEGKICSCNINVINYLYKIN